MKFDGAVASHPIELTDPTTSMNFEPPQAHSPVFHDDDLFSMNTRGIAGTTVTFKDLEAAARTHFGPNLQINRDAEVTVLSDEAIWGLNSRVVIFRNIWNHKGNSEGVKIPSSVCCKLATLLSKTPGDDKAARDRQIASIKNYYDVEIFVYNLLRQNSRTAFLNCVMTRNFTASSPKAFLVLEFVEDARTMNDWEAVSEENMKAILKDLCQLHSLKVDRQKKFLSNRTALWKVRTGRMGLKKIEPFIGKITNFMQSQDFVTKLLKLTNILETRIEEIFAMAKERDVPEVFCHNDLWNYNILMRGDCYRSIIDFQTCHHSYLGLELGRLFSHLLHSFEKVDEFLNFYAEEMLTSHNPTITRENVHQSWNLFYPFHFWGTATSLAIRGEKVCSSAKEPVVAEELIRRKANLLVDLALEGLQKTFPIES